MGIATDIYEPKIITLQQHADDCRRLGIPVYFSGHGWFWKQGERGSCVRFPTPITTTPEPSELNKMHLRHLIPLLSYVREPDAEHPANAYVYKLDAPYVFSKLKSKERRNANKALNAFRYEFIDWDTLNRHGYEAYRDTRIKAQLHDFSPEHFKERMAKLRNWSGTNILACWSGDRLAAFLAFMMFDDRCEGLLWCTNAEFIDNNPNNGLYHTANEFILNRCGMKSFCIGISSLQQTATFGQHRFRVSVGFTPLEVYREFHLHPLLRPLFGLPTLSLLESIQAKFPQQRQLRKIVGAFSLMHGRKSKEIVPASPESLLKPEEVALSEE